MTKSMPRTACVALWLVAALAGTAYAQLDPLLFLQRTKPNIIVAVDLGNRMQRDADEAYYDPYTYTKTGASWEAVVGVTGDNTTSNYRRKYVDLAHTDWSVGGDDKFRATRITVTGDRESSYASFFGPTRLAVARTGVRLALQSNTSVVRLGLVKMRQDSPLVGAEKNEGPVYLTDETQQNPTESGSAGRWKITRPEVNQANVSVLGPVAALIKADAATANADTLALLAKGVEQTGALLPAGRDSRLVVDAPVANLLTDARAEAVRLIAADTQCRNTIVVLVVGGSEGTIATADPSSVATSFLNVSGRRVPIYVIAIAPLGSTDQLRAIATNSGGKYTEVTRAMINATPAGTPVPEVTRAVNEAVQHAFAAQAAVDAPPTPTLPLGPTTEYQTAGPLVGTVNLDGATDIEGRTLPLTEVTTPTGTTIPQRGNVLITAGFGLPGFDGRLRAFRMYKPEADATKPYGWAFVADGTPLWVASLPSAVDRNIYTVLPGIGLTSLSVANVAALAPYLGVSDAAGLIDYVRRQPLGAIIGSTPAFMDPPSLDPPPDADYPEFATDLADRRTMIFFGANDGMLHAIDGRTGIEAWAFVPFNLLPKLRALLNGQAVGGFTYFADGSPKVADVKVGDAWRTYMMVGQGPGGTFYQTFDVTLSGLPAAVSATSDSTSSVVSYFSNASRIPLAWSFPSYASFDPAIAPYGDIRATASSVEKTVGETWSDPAVGQIDSIDGPYVALVGSGFLPYSRQQTPQRTGTVAGTTFYLLDMRTGSVLDSRNVNDDAVAETVDNCAVAGDCRRMKNALQADPVATGPLDARFINRAYVGDLDGRVWRFDLGLSSSGTPIFTSSARQLFDGTKDHPIFSSMASVTVGTQDYLFYGSGSDSLPSVGVSQSYKLFGVLDNGGSGTKKFEVALTSVDNVGDDEKVSAFPAVAGDIVFFSTTTFKPGAGCTAPVANLYAVTFVGGAAYDSNGDGKLSNKDTAKLLSVSGGRATAPFASDQHLTFSVGGKVQIMGDPRDYNNGIGQMGVKILSWRERR